VENPLKNLPKWGQISVVGGGVLVVYLAYRNYETTTAASTSSGTSSGTSGDTTASTASAIDPASGLALDSIDPVTGQEVEAEIEQYGSVSAADSIYEQDGSLDGFAYDDGTLTGSPYSTTTGSTETGANYANNAQWSQAAQQGLTEIGYSATDVAAALGDYLNSIPMSSAYASIVNTALAEYGNPPSGTYTIKISPNGTSSGAGVTVPNVVGRTDLDTAEGLIRAAGLTATATGDSGTGNKGSVISQSPAAGTSVTSGSTVTLTYTVAGSTTTTASVVVPNEVGRTDLDTAKGEITAAGLKATASAASVAASVGNKGKVASQSPKAGTKVAKGSTVTLTYTK
jgi:transcription elongation GreA/GreB family factor